MYRLLMIAVLLLQSDCGSGLKARVGDLEFEYPSNLQLLSDSNSSKSVVLTNFDREYHHGGIIPAKGVEISVVVVRDQKDIVLWPNDCESGAGARIRIDSRPALKITCLDRIGPLELNETRVAVKHAADVYKFFMTANRGDPNQKSYESLFNQILSSAKFVEK